MKCHQAAGGIITATCRRLPSVVTNKETVPVALRKLVMLIELTPVRRSAPDLNHTRYIIDLIRLQCPDTMPAIISADDPVIQSDRTIERQIHVPLHVAVHTEKLSKIIHPETRRVPTTAANAFPTSTALIKSEYGSGALK